jgi:hypothetical protein
MVVAAEYIDVDLYGLVQVILETSNEGEDGRFYTVERWH